ncbi:uncharacterized protein LOC129109846 [Anoplopoma fimbria]|uniref:uncharacterized protein LOC129109846 n=1 Tax=Anoplopoma fimbria TaxID=229290 RepID=UPI0023ED600D|nr:uncharacterized protein LOC129109846 [Anoplopoma fimbria]
MAHFYLQGLVVLVLLIIISECKVIAPVNQTVFAAKEEDILLPCFDSYAMDPKDCYRFKLIKYATDSSQMKVILVRPKTPKFQDAKRVKWDADGNQEVSLLLTKTQLSDAGLYGCEIWQGWDCIHVKNIFLKVKDCKTLPAVKVTPSTPLNLNCPVDITSGQQRPQNISWAMLPSGNPVPFNSERVDINQTSLAFQSVNKSDSGWYRCTYVLGQTQRCFEFNLQVQEFNLQVQVEKATTVPGLTTSEILLETKMEGSSGAFLAVLVASVIIGIAVLAALIGLFIYRRRNTQRVTQQTQRPTTGTLTDAYEIFTESLTPLDDPTAQANCLYQHFLDENMCTFQY